jgi:hypothetical protein
MLNNLILKKMKRKTTSIRIAILPAIVFAALLFSSCSKNELDDVQVSNPAARVGEATTISGMTTGGVTTSTATINTLTPGIPVDAMISISHGPCFGDCPNYTISLSKEGEVVYNGIDNVATRGEVRYNVGSEKARELGNMMVQEGFFKLEDKYTVMPDAPKFQTTLVWDGKIKSVVDYGVNIPIELRTMRDKVEQELNVGRLIHPNGTLPTAPTKS